MNEDPTDLEQELRRLQPVTPSERLTNRLAGILDPPNVSSRPPVSPWWQRLGFNRLTAALGWGLLSPAAAAACVALVLTGHQQTETVLPSPAAASAIPPGALAATGSARAVNVLYQTLDEGVVANGTQEPMRRVRYRSADRVSWHNPQSGAEWEVSYPREDVLLIPVQAE